MGDRRGQTEAVKQNYDKSQLLRTHGAHFLAHTPSLICLLSVTDLLNLGDWLAVDIAWIFVNVTAVNIRRTLHFLYKV